MFRSRTRPVVYPQADHARMAAALAAAWGNDRFARPQLPFDSFLKGVAEHDRGYGELDTDAIGEVSSTRWTEIQVEGFQPRGEDAVVDLVTALHVRRLVSHHATASRTAMPAMNAALPGLMEAAGVEERTAMEADAITNLCDMISFDFCFEQPAWGSVSVPPGPGEERVEVGYRVDGEGGITVTPWPFAGEMVTGMLTGYAAPGYPSWLNRADTPFTVTG
jgi:hypothetical protein